MIARGRYSEIFIWKDHQILKLLLGRFSAADALHQARVTQAVHDAGLPAPAVEGTVEVDGRVGIVFEHVEGPTMRQEIKLTRPWKSIKLARTLAELQAAMHSCEVPALPSQRQQLESRIRDCRPLQSSMKEAVLKALEKLPDGNAVCHGDFQPMNIIMSSGGPVIIDWNGATRGAPLADVARTWLLLRMTALPSGASPRWLIRAARAWFHASYLNRYMQLRPHSYRQIVSWRLPIAAAHLWLDIPEENARLLAFVEASLQHQC